MTKSYDNPGKVNVDQVLDTAKSVTSTAHKDGTIHTTVIFKDANRRFSYDENPDGSLANVHSTNQSNNSHTTYKDRK